MGPRNVSVTRTRDDIDTWQPPRHVIEELAAGTKVTLLSGLNQIDKPDVLEVAAPVREIGLNPGDTLLRDIYRGEGNADFWAKGYWYTNGDLGWVQNADGSGCQGQCKGHEIEVGQAEWWFQVRLADGRVGWTDAADSVNPN
jgi:hypothetical protein